MKVVILAGGFGTRISEESHLKPKPMIEIGEMPILWHIMKGYSFYGFNEFIICAGYKQHMIKEWFSDYFLHTSDVTFDFTSGDKIVVHNKHVEPWKVTVVDTGLNTMTGGRIKQIREYIGNETFMITYGDAVGNVNIKELFKYHKTHKKIGTVSVCNFSQNKGILEIGDDGLVNAFREKSKLDSNLVNIGFMVMEAQIFDYIDGNQTVFEKEPMQLLIKERQLQSYVHKGFWQCMDTLREKQRLEKFWETGDAPWKNWRD